MPKLFGDVLLQLLVDKWSLDNLEDNIQSIFQLQNLQVLTPHNKLITMWLMWQIWKSRNEFLFQQKNRDPLYVMNKSLSDVNEWLEATQTAGDDTAHSTNSHTCSRDSH